MDLQASIVDERRRKEIVFGTFRLFPISGQLFSGAHRIPLGHRAVDILALLAGRPGEMLRHDEIIAHAWPRSVVEGNNLRVQISAIRKALEEGQGGHIQNIPGRGYRLVVDATDTDAAKPDESVRTVVSASPASSGSSELIGRDDDIESVHALFKTARCITIAGPGGVGKSRFAQQMVEVVARDFSGGIARIDLSTVGAGDAMPTALAAVLGLPLQGDEVLAALCRFLGARHVLLVLDNCEHRIADVRAFVAALLVQTEHLTVLSTSREPLRIVGENVYRLAGLACPPLSSPSMSLDAVLRFPSVALLVRHLQAKASLFYLNEKAPALLTQLCNRLDGLPLALELAAGRVQSLGLYGLVQQIDNHFAVLVGGRRTANVRQHSMQSTLEWSHSLLVQDERTALIRVSLFRGAFSQEQAVHVVCDGALAHEDTIAALNGLVAKSLLLAESAGTVSGFRMLNTTRAYAEKLLHKDPDAARVRLRYAETIRDMAWDLTPQGLADEAELHRRYGIFIEEARQAVVLALADDEALALAAEILLKARYAWFHLSRFGEFIMLAERVLSRSSHFAQAAATAPLLISLGTAIYNAAGPTARMREALEQGLACAEADSDTLGVRAALRGLWIYHHGLGEYAQSMYMARRYRQYTKDDAEAGTVLATMRGISQLQKGRLRRAFKYLAFANIRSNPHFGLSADAYDYHQSVVETAILARTSWLQGSFAMAFALAEESLQAAKDTQRPTSIAFALAVAVCPILLWSGKAGDAAPHIATLHELAGTHAMQHWMHYGALYRESLAFSVYHGPQSPREPQGSDAWTHRHREDFSVLPGGTVPPSFLTRAKSSDPIWCSAENLRTTAIRQHESKGDSYLPQTINVLNKSIALARTQGALSWELRASNSLAPLLSRQRKRDDARALVSRMIDRFDRFDSADATDDILCAHALLRVL